MFIVRDITKAYHGRSVLEAVSFALPAGHCLGVTGENGAGKSTLLRILAQVDAPDRGDILFGGRSVLGDKQFLRKSLGYVPQNCDLLPDLTAGQQLRLWQAACGCRGPLPGDVAELLDFPELEKVILSECGLDKKTWIDNETMAAFREKMRSEYKVVWTVRINNLKVRTDETYFMPAKYGEVVTNYQVQNLKYCEDMICVDLGHMAIQNIEFVEYMPHLKYFIVVDAPFMYIDSISTCKELIYLEFFWTWINDFTPLLECTALEDLNLARTNGDPMVLKEMTWLKNLWIDGKDLTDAEKVELEAALPNTYIKYCYGLMAGNGWRDLPNYFAMRDLLGMPYNTW